MSDFALFLTATGAAIIAAMAAIAAVFVAFRGRKTAAGNGAPIHNGNGKHRPWFRFWLTLVGLLGFFVIIETILTGTIKLTVTTAALIGSVLNGLITLLILAFKWWFESADEKPDTFEDATSAPNGHGHAAKPPEPTPAPIPQKARPDDY